MDKPLCQWVVFLLIRYDFPRLHPRFSWTHARLIRYKLIKTGTHYPYALSYVDQRLAHR